MADTLREMVGHVRLHNADVPYFLAAQWIRDRYRRIMDGRNWACQRAETEILTETVYATGTVTVTRNSATIAGSGTTWTSAMVGRQFMVGSRGPVYTIATFVSTTSLTLDRVYGGTTAAGAAYQILTAYATLPVAFKQFIAVLDPVRAWQLRFWVSQETLARADPQRTTFQDPILLADLKITSTGAPMFELWPYAVDQRNFVVKYYQQVDDLVDPDDEPLRPIRGDILVKGALADLARWPGTASRPNPAMTIAGAGRMDVSGGYETEFQMLLDRIEVVDENLFLTWLQDADWANWPYAPMDARWAQSHAVMAR